MNFQEVINKRHSIREYEKKQIPKKIIKDVIISATKSPSGANTQPWIFYVVQNKKKRDKMAEIIRDYYRVKANRERMKKNKYRKIVEKFYANLGDAPCCIFVYYKKMIGFPDVVLSASTILAAGNLMNAAVEKGLGTCWIHSFLLRRKKVNKILNAPKDQKLVAPLIIGYPKKGYRPLIRSKKNLNEVLKFV